MEISYKRDLNHNYLIIRQENLTGREYSIRMIEQNHLPELLPVQVRNQDGEPYLFYDITSKQPLSQIFERRPIGSRDMVNIWTGMLRAFACAKQYLLQDEEFLLDPDYMYMNMESGSLQLCYVPMCGQDARAGVRSLAELILKRLDHDDSKAVFLGYEFYGKVSAPNAGIHSLLEELLREAEESSGKDVRPGSSRMSSVNSLQPVHDSVQETLPYENRSEDDGSFAGYDETEDRNEGKKKKNAMILWMIAAGILLALIYAGIAYFGKLDLTQMGGLAFLIMAVVWLFHSILRGKKQTKKRWTDEEDEDEDEEEAFLEALMTEFGTGEAGDPGMDFFRENRMGPSESSRKQEETAFGETRCLAVAGDTGEWHLISQSPGRYPDIDLGSDTLLIGKKREQVDICLKADSVSRIHAKIQKKGEDFHLLDLNSTNGTFVNGERLQPHESRLITEHDRISFATVHYRAEKR